VIDWLAFLTVLVASVVSACAVVALFAAGLRLVSDDGTPGATGRRWRRPLGVASFVLCGAAILYGVYLIIPALHR
jgi:hypothetical protein